MPCKRTICPHISENACPERDNVFGGGSAAKTSPPVNSNTNTSTNTSTNSTARRRRRIRVLQNVTCNITDCQTCATSTTCSACSNSKLLSFDKKTCVLTCGTNYEPDSANKMCQKKSTKKSYFYTTMPDPYVKADTTYTDVKTALADAKFKSLFESKANLGNITYDTPELIQVTGELGNVSVVDANLTVNGETSATFAAKINGTDGHIFFGYALGTVDRPNLKDFKAGKLSNNTKL